MTYPLTFYTDRFIPKQSAGCIRIFLLPIIFIRPKYRDDRGLYEHELMHVKQWLWTFGLHPFLYLLVPAYRLRSEVECYKEQAKQYPDDRRPLFASYISQHYDLNITPQQALELLK